MKYTKVYTDKKILSSEAAIDLTSFIQKIGEKCYLKNVSNAFKIGHLKINSPHWRGRYCCVNDGCAEFEFEIAKLNEETDETVSFTCIIKGSVNHSETLNFEALKRINAREKTEIALKFLSNENNIETVANNEIVSMTQDASKPSKLIQSFESLKDLNIKHKLKDRYRKIQEDLYGKFIFYQAK